jgi:uncharacterized protein
MDIADMTNNEMISLLSKAGPLPEDALRASVADADALAPHVLASCDKLLAGVFLMPDERRFLLHGLYVLGAARDARLYHPLLQMTQINRNAIDVLFGDMAMLCLQQLLISAYDGDDDALFAAIAREETSQFFRWTLFGVLARLAWEGRIDRLKTAAFLERFEREALADDSSAAWIGWEDAVVALGLTQLEGALRRVWEKEPFHTQNDVARAQTLKILAAPGADSWDEEWFAREQLAAIEDPVKILREVHASFEVKEISEASAETWANDPAASVRLTAHELVWLASFLASSKVPDAGMDLEMLDGFLTALAIGPKGAGLSEAELIGHLQRVWDPADGVDAPSFDSPEQEAFVIGLMFRHVKAIVARTSVGEPHPPIIFAAPDTHRGGRWTLGFSLGVNWDEQSWRPIFSFSKPSLIASVLTLGFAAADPDMTQPSVKLRYDILDKLPAIILTVAQFWRDWKKHGRFDSPAKPIGSQPRKVGRNEPCPCGSGKKYKRCCGGT